MPPYLVAANRLGWLWFDCQ